jgi:uncharacterized protein
MRRLALSGALAATVMAGGIVGWLFVGSSGLVQAQRAGAPPAAGAPQAPARAPQAPGGGAAAGAAPAVWTRPEMAQGGSGPLKVLFISQFHPFDRENYFLMLDALGKDITWTHVENPAAELFLEPKAASRWDVLLFFDLAGRKPQVKAPDGTTKINPEVPSPELRANFKALLQSGKPLVFTHHSIASWAHTWPEYTETMGGACDWGNPLTFRGKQYPVSGAASGIKEHVTVVDKTHPIVQGIGEGYDAVDEMYLCPYAEDSVHPLLRSDFKAIDTNFPRRYATGWRYPGEGSSLAGWYKSAEISPVVYLRNGHDRQVWENPAYRTLLLNALKWAASPEAKAWAKAHPTKIYK